MRSLYWKSVWGLATLLTCAAIASAEPAEPEEPEEPEETIEVRPTEVLRPTPSPGFIDDWIGEVLGVGRTGTICILPHRCTWLDSDPLSPVTNITNDVRDELEEAGFSFELGVTSIVQVASDRIGSRPPVLWSFSYDFCGEWRLLDDATIGAGDIGWHLEGGRPIGDRRTTDLSGDIGSMLGINDDLDGEPVALTELWWKHTALDGALTITLGKIDPTYFYDGNRIPNCERTQFFATPLVNNAAIAFPDNGLGANLTITPAEWCCVSAGIHDGRAVATRTGFNTLDEGELFYACEIGFTPEINGYAGAYRLMAWTTEVDDQHGRGFALSFDQEILPGAGVVPFCRYGYSEGEVADYDHQISVGVGFEGLLGRADDLLAIGYVWADPTDASLRQESLMEVFYRIQLTDSTQITPDVQFVFDPAGNTDRDVVTVVGLRVQMDF